MTRQRTTTIAMVGAAVLVLLVWFMFVFRPTRADISDTREQLATAEQEEQSLRATLQRLEGIEEDRPALESELRRLTAAIPPQPELANFILAAHDIASRAEIDFLSITPAPPEPTPALNISTISMSIRAEGRFFNVLDYLDRLEELERIVVIDELALARQVAAEEVQQQAQAAQTGAAPAPASPAPGAGGGGSADPAAPVSFEATFGQVTTDAGSLGQTASTTTTTTTAPAANIALVPTRPSFVPSEILVAVDIQARAFTTATPPPEGAPPGGAPPPPATGETTTTVPGETATTATTAPEGT